MHNFDLSALDSQPSRRDVRLFRSNSIAAGVPRTDAAAPSFRGGCTSLLVVPFAIAIVAFALVGFAEEGFTLRTIVVALVSVLMVSGAVLIVARIRLPRLGSRLWRDRMRLNALSADNGCAYVPVTTASTRHTGLLFDARPTLYDVIASRQKPAIEIGNLSYQQNTGRGGAIDHHWGYICVQLERSFPHTILDSRTNNGLQGQQLPVPYRGGAIQLEGGFPKHFTLYCPSGYGADMRYLLTPDLMADLIDEGSRYDVEIIDDWMIFYRPLGFQLGKKDEWHAIQHLLDRVAADMRKRTGRYSDDRSLDGSVAPHGLRMQRVNVLPWIIGSTVVIFAVGFLLDAVG